jgi:riboflavin kinase/FMN adenylyltransferase
MQVIHGLSGIPESLSHSAVAIGNFDGLHLGHQRLLSQMLEGAASKKLVPAVLTFFPHPVQVLNPEKKLEQLTTTTEKLDLMKSIGVEFVCVASFDKTLSDLSPDEFFARYLLKGLRAKLVFVGYNFRFGKNRTGDTELLKKLCEKHNIILTVVEAVSVGDKVSSSLIREKIVRGQVEEANRLLGRPYAISGTVMPGDGRGKQIGFPTANLHCAAEKVLPKNGVYVTQAKWQLQSFRSITNFGVRPTFYSSDSPKLVEVHILDLEVNLYDESLSLEFLAFVRDEMKFNSIEELTKQIKKDIAVAKNFS